MQLRELPSLNKTAPRNAKVSMRFVNECFDEVDAKKTFYSLVDIVESTNQSTKLRSLVEQLHTLLSRELTKTNSNIDAFLELLNQPQSDALSYYDKVTSLRNSISNNITQIKLYEDKLNEINLTKFNDSKHNNENSLEWLEQNTKPLVTQAMKYLENTKQIMPTTKKINVGEQYINCLANLKDECEGSFEKVKELYKNICSECSNTLERGTLCEKLFIENIDKICDKQLDSLLNIVEVSELACRAYHKRALTFVDEQIIECKDNGKSFFANVTNFLNEYKTAYEQHRKNTQKAVEVCDSMKKSTPNGTKSSKNSEKSKSSQTALHKTDHNDISKINTTKTRIEKSANSVRVDYKIDTSQIKSRAESLEDVLQKY